MIVSTAPGLGFSVTSPFKAVARGAVAAGKGVERGTVAAARGTGALASRYGKSAAMLAVLPVVEVNRAIVAPVLKATVLRPVISRINTLKDRRARKLAWDNRKSTTPTPAERSQASSWTKSHLRSQAPPLGLMMSVLAGSSHGMPQIGRTGLGEPTTATITAAVPALIALLNSILGKANANGDAPAHVGGGSATVADGSDQAADGSGQDAPSGGGLTLPGGLHLTKKQLLIGGGAVGVVLLIVLLRR